MIVLAQVKSKWVGGCLVSGSSANFDCVLPSDVRDEPLGRKRKRASGVLASKPVRGGLIVIGSSLARVLLWPSE